MTTRGPDVCNDDVMHRSADDLEEQIEHVEASPSVVGKVEIVVCRPAVDERRLLDTGQLVVGSGLAGDNYVERGNKRTPDGRAHPLAVLTLMNSRALEAVAGPDHERWALAGDQLIVDFDLSVANAPAGTMLQVGTALIEVTPKPHTGCAKFGQRFGMDAARWINSRKDLRLRGINAVVLKEGVVSPGDSISKDDTEVSGAAVSSAGELDLAET